MRWKFWQKEPPEVNHEKIVVLDSRRMSEKFQMREVWPTYDSDLCDRCKAPAKVRVIVPHNLRVLDFCAHHYRKHRKRIIELEYMLIDNRPEESKL